MVKKRSTTKTQFRTKLDFLCPDYYNLFSDVFSVISLALLTKYRLDEILVKPNSTLTTLVSKASKGHKKLEFIKKLKSVLNQYELINSNFGQCLELQMLVEEINYFTFQINKIDEEIKNETTNNSFTSLLTTIPGINIVSAAVIIGELGDLSRFNSPKQLVAFAGLDCSTYQSGKMDLRGHISKRGSGYLRNILFLDANAAKLHNDSFNILYEHHKQNGKHHYVILNAMARKLLHIIWGMHKHQTPFDEKLLNNF